MKSLERRIVLITGAGGGFGREMIRQFLQHGSYLIVSDRRPELLQAAVEWALESFGGRWPAGRILGYIAADLSSPAGSVLLHERAQAIAPVEVLINNAGIGMSGSFEALPLARWEALMQLNLLAPMRLTAAFLPQMIARGSGHIVNIASVAGLIGVPGLAAYCAAKFGLRGFGEALAADLRQHGIDVTTIYPFFARTPILDSERFGAPTASQFPAWLIYDPAFVVGELIAGIRKRKQHVYPGAIPQQIDLLRRLAPELLRRLVQR